MSTIKPQPVGSDPVDMTDAAYARWQSIQANTRVPVVLYDVMSDGGFTFGVDLSSGWREFAVNPDGGKAYPIDF